MILLWLEKIRFGGLDWSYPRDESKNFKKKIGKLVETNNRFTKARSKIIFVFVNC